MPYNPINNGDTGLVARTKINSMFDELYKGNPYNASSSYRSGDVLLYDDRIYIVEVNTAAGENPDNTPEKFRILKSNVEYWKGSTSNSTSTEIYLYGILNNRKTVDIDTSLSFEIKVSAKNAPENIAKFWRFYGIIVNEGGTTIIKNLKKVVIHQDGSYGGTYNTSNWDVEILANDSDDSLVIQVTGENTKPIEWRANLESVDN